MYIKFFDPKVQRFHNIDIGEQLKSKFKISPLNIAQFNKKVNKNFDQLRIGIP